MTGETMPHQVCIYCITNPPNGGCVYMCPYKKHKYNNLSVRSFKSASIYLSIYLC